MDNLEIGTRIKLRREELEKSLQDIANSTGLARSTIQRYEAGHIKKLKLPVIESIARALAVRPDWIIGKTDEKYPEPETAPQIIQYYDQLNTTGKEAATEQVRLLTLDEKYTRPDNIVSVIGKPLENPYDVSAAHEIPGASIEDKQFDEDLMDDDSIWE